MRSNASQIAITNAQVTRSAAARSRLSSIDVVRGLAISLMALDHTRDFFSASGQNPRDVAEPALFITRYITHFCAPTFILLAGLSAYLYGSHGHSIQQVSWFLFSRGVWLIVVEFTIVTFGWKLTLDSGLLIAQVIWAIGPSMVILSVLIYLPQALIVVISLLVIAGHNFFDFITAGSLGHASWIWVLLHLPGVLDISPAVKLLVIYPLVPWPAVMAVGYVLGPLFIGDSKYRRTFLLSCGSTLLVGFFLLRASNIYRDPTPWRSQCSLIAAALSFLDCEKYPPSLLFLMMTLGPAMILLAVLEKKDSTVSVILKTFGRVPFLFYVVHLPLIHAAAIVLAWLTISNVDWLFGSFVPAKPAGYGLDLPGVYLVWIGVLVLLYPFCAWFAGLKDRRKDWWWLSYL